MLMDATRQHSEALYARHWAKIAIDDFSTGYSS
jgi:EAL domain-containing protein (putative c-di-GMP-specific phosphodiesterase class I)